ncbi:hypothetical protein ACFVRD_45455, partial [Streptomyces sp. NPDC057908]|uniref:hypothetical protein n=1 Tax=Streptomyces sp. NPDC057908 TaxID=3346276 RepID=UPI0036E7BE51
MAMSAAVRDQAAYTIHDPLMVAGAVVEEERQQQNDAARAFCRARRWSVARDVRVGEDPDDIGATAPPIPPDHRPRVAEKAGS